MTRAITFPRQANGDYVNRETGVMFQRYQGGWRAFRPAATSTGYIGLCMVVRNMSVARQVATRYVVDSARAEIAKAYDEAVAEDAQRTTARHAQNHRSGWIGRAGEINRETGCGFFAARQAVMDELHAEALTEDGRRSAARLPDFRPGERFRLDPLRGGREYEVRDVRAGIRPAVNLRILGELSTFTSVYADILIEWAHADALAEDARRALRQAADNQLASTGWIERIKAFRERTGCGLREALEGARDELHAEALAEQARRDAAGIIAEARVPEAVGATMAGSGLPPVPEDVDDDAAWAAYCELLPEPTEAERLATAREHGPYARDRAEAVEAFRTAVQSYRRLRGEWPTELGERVLANLRRGMRTAAETVRLYDQLTQAWLTGEGVDAARDAFRQSF